LLLLEKVQSSVAPDEFFQFGNQPILQARSRCCSLFANNSFCASLSAWPSECWLIFEQAYERKSRDTIRAPGLLRKISHECLSGLTMKLRIYQSKHLLETLFHLLNFIGHFFELKPLLLLLQTGSHKLALNISPLRLWFGSIVKLTIQRLAPIAFFVFYVNI